MIAASQRTIDRSCDRDMPTARSSPSSRVASNSFFTVVASGSSRTALTGNTVTNCCLRDDGATTTDAGILVNDPEGFAQIEAPEGAALRAHTLSTLMGVDIGALVDRFRHPLGQPLAVTLPDGRRFHLQARFNWPVWTASPLASATAERTSEPPSASPLSNGRRAGGDSPVAELASRPASRTAVPASPGLQALHSGDPQIATVVDKIRRVRCPVLVLLNKIDLVSKGKLLPLMQRCCRLQKNCRRLRRN